MAAIPLMVVFIFSNTTPALKIFPVTDLSGAADGITFSSKNLRVKAPFTIMAELIGFLPAGHSASHYSHKTSRKKGRDVYER